jgi:hypothetical protein
MTRSHSLAAVLTFVPALSRGSIIVAAAPAIAASRGAEQYAAQERAARKACLKGDYGKGVDILADLFVDTKDPTYIFNQGRCFEQNRRYEDAIGRFEEYLRRPGQLRDGSRARRGLLFGPVAEAVCAPVTVIA